MAKKLLTIDLQKWCTIAEKAKATGVKIGTVSARIARARKGIGADPIEYLDVPELGITLVRR